MPKDSDSVFSFCKSEDRMCAGSQTSGKGKMQHFLALTPRSCIWGSLSHGPWSGALGYPEELDLGVEELGSYPSNQSTRDAKRSWEYIRNTAPVTQVSKCDSSYDRWNGNSGQSFLCWNVQHIQKGPERSGGFGANMQDLNLGSTNLLDVWPQASSFTPLCSVSLSINWAS